MAVVVHITDVQKALSRELQRAIKDSMFDVVVGYTADYAIFVHENLTARHKKGKQAKFLEEPAKTYGREMGTIIVRAFQKTRQLVPALVLAGFFLQRKSQRIVPVDTGNLKGSAFTRKVAKGSL